MLKLYFHPSPNPMKVALFLEEAGLPYQLIPIDIYRGDQHQPSFLALNPNAKLPALDDDGVILFDSNAILLHLGEKTGRFIGAAHDRAAHDREAHERATHERAAHERAELLSWLMFVASGLGPFCGQSAHFLNLHKDSAYAANRYRREAERHFAVLDRRLKGRDFIATSEYSIVDMSAWGWIDRAGFVLAKQQPLEEFPDLARWFAAIDSRPAARRAREAGAALGFKRDFDEETLRALFPQNFAPAAAPAA